MLQKKVMIRRGRLTAIKGRKKEWKRKLEEKKIASFRASNRHMADKTFGFSEGKKNVIVEHVQILNLLLDGYTQKDVT
jgi:hypothetical protein